MNAIERNKALISDIEAKAGTYDPTDYEGLYTLLLQAYNAAKDLAILYSNLPQTSDTEIAKLKEVIVAREELITSQQSTITTLEQHLSTAHHLATEMLEATGK